MYDSVGFLISPQKSRKCFPEISHLGFYETEAASFIRSKDILERLNNILGLVPAELLHSLILPCCGYILIEEVTTGIWAIFPILWGTTIWQHHPCFRHFRRGKYSKSLRNFSTQGPKFNIPSSVSGIDSRSEVHDHERLRLGENCRSRWRKSKISGRRALRCSLDLIASHEFSPSSRPR